MASIPSSPVAASATKEMFKEHKILPHSNSGKDFPANQASLLRRSYSDNHLCCSVNRIHATATKPKLKNSRSMGIFPFQITGSIIPNSLRSFLFDPETSKDMNIVEKEINTKEEDANTVENSVEDSEGEETKRANWVERLMEVRRHYWRINKQQQESLNGDGACEGDENGDCDVNANEGECRVCYGSEEEQEEEIKYDCESFSRLLVRVPWSDTKLFSQLAFLSNMAYVITEIKAKDLRRYYGLQFVTSSLEKKAEAATIKAKLHQDSVHVPVSAGEATESGSEKAMDSEKKRPIRPSVAYEIAASAASYVQSRTKGLLPLGSESQQEDSCIDLCGSGNEPGEEEERSPPRVYKSEVAAYVAASTMTALVAAGEMERQEAARDLQSLHSSPCEWFVCDDGSDSLASWRANLLFEPTKFEGTEVLVHRGIYEAAKGIYEQFMPEIIEHLHKYGERAKFQFTGHSLGGSLSLLIHLMLLARKVVKPSTLRPVVTFGSPFVFCGGKKILEELGLDDNHIHSVIMHRDIVPRAFSSNYPNHVAIVLKRLNGIFRSHPCLLKQKLLYSPMGKIFILQPDEKSSPPHPLLPPGSALYTLEKPQCGSPTGALKAFLNSPHPLETLSDPTAYGSEGTILRDHDSSNYLKAVNGVLRQHTKMVVRKVRKERNQLWPLLTSPSPHTWNQKENCPAG